MPSHQGNPESGWVFLRELPPLYRDPFTDIRQDWVRKPNGKEGPYTYNNADQMSAYVVAVREDPDGQRRVAIVDQDRYLTDVPHSWELPAGYPEPGETGEQTPRRELRSETGLVAGRVERIGVWQAANALTDERVGLWLMTDLKQEKRDEQPDEGAVRSCFWLTFPEGFAAIENGKITDSLSVGAFLHAAMHLGELQPRKPWFSDSDMGMPITGTS